MCNLNAKQLEPEKTANHKTDTVLIIPDDTCTVLCSRFRGVIVFDLSPLKRLSVEHTISGHRKHNFLTFYALCEYVLSYNHTNTDTYKHILKHQVVR